ncbi:hypothetical protein L5515_005650 [Caenorhabditis briggsae]|uniref:Uncharacterized protein n=1 Tax=Caenorhabditis briggsae TaxID=6238 RepID=A0AAE9ETB6_CAEBR|nr:hypothetical protein L5515_005650 [Caenorhabditis briggsae]
MAIDGMEFQVSFFHSQREVDFRCLAKIGQLLKLLDEECSGFTLTEIGLYVEKLPDDIEEWSQIQQPIKCRLSHSSKYTFVREGGAVYTTSEYERCKQMRVKPPFHTEYVVVTAALVVCYQTKNSRFLTYIFDTMNQTVVKFESAKYTKNVGIKDSFDLNRESSDVTGECSKEKVTLIEAPSQDDSFDTFNNHSSHPKSTENLDKQSDDSFDEWCAATSIQVANRDVCHTFQSEPNSGNMPNLEIPQASDESDDSFEQFCLRH